MKYFIISLIALSANVGVAAPAFPATEGKAYIAHDGVHLRFSNPRVQVNGKNAFVHKEAARAFCSDIFQARAQNIETTNRHNERFAKFNNGSWGTFSANKEKAVESIDCGPLQDGGDIDLF